MRSDERLLGRIFGRHRVAADREGAPSVGASTRVRRPRASGRSSGLTIKRRAGPPFFSPRLTGQMARRDTCADLPPWAGGGGVALDPEEDIVGAGKPLRAPQEDHRRAARRGRGRRQTRGCVRGRSERGLARSGRADHEPRGRVRDGDLGRRGREDQDRGRRAGIHRGARRLARTITPYAGHRGGRGVGAPAFSSLMKEKTEIEIAGYRFKDEALLENALTHSSYLHEHVDEAARDFERFEFLGDAVVDLVVCEELFRRFPDATEGELTALRATLVSSAALAEVGRRLGLPERARLGRGEEDTGGRARVGLAASLYESVVGAIYMESGLDEASALVRRTMGDAIAATVTAPPKSPNRLLQEWAQAGHHPLPLYRTLDVSGPEHRRDFVVQVEVAGNVAQGSGPSKRVAEEAAAAKLIEIVTQ